MNQWAYERPTEEWVPHPYQERLMSLMLRQAAAGGALDPGLGKTSCSLGMFKILKSKGHAHRALVVAPLRPLYDVWPEEIKKWATFKDLKYHILHGSGRVISHVPDDVDLILVNPEGLLWLMDDRHPHRLEELECDVLIIDESTRFKDSRTKRFKLLRKCINKFKRRYILTGSIVPNGLLDLFGQIYILDRGNALGEYITHYRRKYFHQPDGAYNAFKWEPNPGAFDKIVERVSPLLLQLQAEDYLDMPALLHSTVPVHLPEEAQEAYEQMESEFMLMLSNGVPLIASNAAVVGGKCRQIANGRVYYNIEDEGLLDNTVMSSKREVHVLHDQKVQALEDLLEELQGAPVLVLYEFQHDKDAILEKWPNTPVLGGGLTPKKASAIIQAFNSGSIPVLAGHPASMGHGLNLQASCHHVIWYGITWNFEYYDQAIRRVYRQGQKAPTVFVYHIVAKGTLDEKVLRVLQAKERGQRDLLNALIDPI